MKITDEKDLQSLFIISLIFRLATLPVGPLGQLIMGAVIIVMNLVFFFYCIKLNQFTETKFIVFSILQLLILLFTGYAIYWGAVTFF